MRILAVSDLHLDHVTHGVARLGELRDALLVPVLEVAVERKVDLVAFLGDLCDPDDGPAVLQSLAVAREFSRALRHANIPQLWLAGNHTLLSVL